MPNPAGYNYYGSNPTPQIGLGSQGGVPGVIGTPPSIYDELQQNVPNYSGLTKTATGDIGSELSGRLSTGTQNLLQDKAAAFGVNSGMPGGTPGNTLTTQNFLNSLGLTSEGLSHEGLTDYNTFTGTAGGEQTDPNLNFGVATQNALDAAAPNPASAATYSQQLYDKYSKPNPAAPTDPEAWKLNGDINNVPGQSITGGDSTQNYAKTASQGGYYT